MRNRYPPTDQLVEANGRRVDASVDPEATLRQQNLESVQGTVQGAPTRIFPSDIPLIAVQDVATPLVE